MKRFRVGLIVGAAMGLASAGAQAQGLWEWTTTGNLFTDGVWDFATAFTVGSTSLTASGLGYFADPSTGNVDGNSVSLFQCSDAACDGTGTLLATTTVTNTYALNGHFRYVTIAPITLTAGDSYEVAGVSNVDNYAYNDTGFHNNSDVTLLNSSNCSGQNSLWQSTSAGTQAFFISTAGTGCESGINDGFWGANVFTGSASGFTGAPEPATLSLLGLGLVGLGFARRRLIRAA